MTAYDRLMLRFTRVAIVQEAISILDWDSEVIMPPGGGPARADQVAVLAGVTHTLMTEPAVADDLAAAEAGSAKTDDPWHAANLRHMRRQHTRSVALPTDLVEARSRANSLCEQAWRDACPQSDFASVRPLLTEVFRLAREAAQALSEALDLPPYDALMDGFQRGITAVEVEPVFARYTTFLASALAEAEVRQKTAVPLDASFPIARQQDLCRMVAQRIGLDFRHARLDASAHPFCGGHSADIRVTTRYDEADPAQALFAVAHECGHAVYEAGLPAAWTRQPVGSAAGMAAHESQSLIIEMQACRSDAFLSWLSPVLYTTFGGNQAAFAPANLARLWRRVEPGFIRVDADEMTYPAHVALRFDLERALLAGNLAIADLPAAWNDEMRCRLGITPPNDSLGCLQDIHWYAGLIGYFPNYTLGAIAAAQLMAAVRQDTSGLDAALARGDFTPLMAWLRTRVHAQGAVYGLNELLVHATGKPLDIADFETHLRARYLGMG